MTIRRLAALSLLALLLAGCALKTPPLPATAPTEDHRRAAVCEPAARQSVPTAWALVEEAAERSWSPTLTRVHGAVALYWPGGYGLAWIGIKAEQQRRYTAAFTECMSPCGTGFCARDRIEVTLPDPDAPWMLRP